MKTSLLLLSILLLTLIKLPSIVTATTVQDVCVKSTFPQACAQFLNSDPRRATNNLFVIAQIAIDKALTIVTANDKKVKSLLAQTKDPSVKIHLNECLALYDSAIFACGRATDLIVKKDYGGLNGVGSFINGSGADCQRSLGGPTLRDDNTNAIVIGEVIAVISNLFAGKV